MKLTKNEVLVLKMVKQAKSRRLYTEYEGKKFYYPRKGMVEAKDWLDDDNCGHGLHGLEWGVGSYDISEHGDTFVILKVNKTDGYVNLDGKVKFRRGKVVLVTKNNAEMTRFIRKYAPASTPVSMSYDSDVVVNQGYYSIAKQGSYSTANQGYYSIAKQGSYSTANQGDYSIAKQGSCSIANQGIYSIAKQGSYSTAKQGSYSTAKQGDWSTAKQGDWSTAKQGDWSTANQGHCSTANQGLFSIAHQGNSSTTNQGDWSTTKQGDWSTATVYGGNYIYRNTGSLSAIIMFCGYKAYMFKGGKDYQPNETVLIRDCKIAKKYKCTPENISKLSDYEVFVFGSNLNGNHSGGSAKLARDKFGAVDGRGEGLQGQSYAFPTLGRNMKRLKEWRLRKAVERLVKCACENTDKIFLVTKVGCGIAGYDEEYMIKIFNSHWLPANIVLPKGWLKIK